MTDRTKPERLAQVAVLAKAIFEDDATASAWMNTPNLALGGQTPTSLCKSEVGAQQVRRALQAIDTGGPV